MSIRFDTVDGDPIERDYTMDEAFPEIMRSPPTWLQNPRRSWEHPQDPILFTGTVTPGREAEARAVVFGEEQT